MGIITLKLSIVLMCMISTSIQTDQALNLESTAGYWNDVGQKTLHDILNRKDNENVAKNVIVFIGDGMGISTITAARIFKGQNDGQKGEDSKLNFETFPHSALVKTYNVDRQVPDSAGTASAIFTGVKTNMAMLGVTAAVEFDNCGSILGNEVSSVLDWAQKEGKATGIISTTKLTDATPAALYCHVANRNWESDDKMPPNSSSCKDIASQLIEDEPGRNIKVILGGGRKHFLPENAIDQRGHRGQRLDKKNLIKQWENSKRSPAVYVASGAELRTVDVRNTEYLLGLFSDDVMAYDLDRDNGTKGEPSLAEMTETAISILQKNDKGFFLMVEGARIDHGHHENKAIKALGDVLSLEKAIQVALDKLDLSNTLVMVTADHSHTLTISGYPLRGTPILGVADVSNVDNLTYTTLSYSNGITALRERTINVTNRVSMGINYTQHSTVPLNVETHAGEDVAIFAIGPMAKLFQGVIEQNYIAHALGYASCIGINQNHCKSGSPSMNSISILTIFTTMSLVILR